MEHPGLGAVLRGNPAFRLLLLGTVSTNTGFWMYQVAVGWLALQLTDSPLFVGLAGFAGGIPQLLFALPAGVIIDRFDRRLILLLAQAGSMLTASVLAATVAADMIRPWSMLLLVFFYGTIMTFIFQVRSVMVPSMVARRDLQVGVGVNSAVQNATRVVGPSLAGVLIAVIGLSSTFVLAAGLQVFALAATWQLPRQARLARAPGSTWSQLLVGVKVVSGEPYLRALIFLALAPTVLVMPYLNQMPVFARDVLGLGSTGLGVLLACSGLGTVIGSLMVAQSRVLSTQPMAQVYAAAAFAVGVVAFAITTNIVVGALLLGIAGAMSAIFLAINQTAIQLAVNDEVRGRVMSVSMLTWGVLPVGQLAVGALGSAIGIPMALMTSCLAAVGMIALVLQRYAVLREPPALVIASG